MKQEAWRDGAIVLIAQSLFSWQIYWVVTECEIRNIGGPSQDIIATSSRFHPRIYRQKLCWVLAPFAGEQFFVHLCSSLISFALLWAGISYINVAFISFFENAAYHRETSPQKEYPRNAILCQISCFNWRFVGTPWHY